MKLVFEHTFAASREALFAFHERPGNLALLNRRWPAIRLVAHEEVVRPGGRTTVAIRLGPFRVDLTLEHFVHEPPLRFGETQARGPFRRFRHVHEFEVDGSGTRLRDRLEFALPWYLGGPLADRLVVARDFRRWFAYRHAELAALIAEGLVPGAGA